MTGLFGKGFAEYAVADAGRVLHLPDNIAFSEAFGEPLACAMSAARRTVVDLGDRVAIVGLGFMGQLMLRLLTLKGAASIVGIDPRANVRDLALTVGCDRVFESTAAAEAAEAPFDLVVEATGTPEGLTAVGQLVREHGRLCILGYHQGGPRQVDMQMWNYKALDVLNGHERRVDYRMDCMRRALDLASRGKLNLSGLATHRFPLENVDDAFAALATKPEGFVKAMGWPRPRPSHSFQFLRTRPNVDRKSRLHRHL